MSDDYFDEVPSTWLALRAAVQLMVRTLGVDPKDAARELVAGIRRGEVLHRLAGDVPWRPFGCDYSWDMPWSGLPGRQLVVKE